MSSRSYPMSCAAKEVKTVEADLLLYVAGNLFLTAIAWSIVAPWFDDSGDSRWVMWTLLGAAALCLAGHVASGGLL